jgi:hypothetical protein
VGHRRVVILVRGLDAALCHHGVGVADAKLGDDHHVRPAVVRLDRGRGAGAAAADDQHVDVIVDLRQIDIDAADAAFALQQPEQLDRDLVALIGAYLQYGKSALAVIGMVFVKYILFFLGGHSSGFGAHANFSGRFNIFDRSQHFRCKHLRPSFTSRYRVDCKAP